MTDLVIGDRVIKLKGVGKGERGTVRKVTGDKVKVAHETGEGFFLIQSARNFSRINSEESVCIGAPEEEREPELVNTLPRLSVREPQPRQLFAKRYSFTACCWNALKLGFVDDPNRAKLVDDCLTVLGNQLRIDVLMLSEISKVVGIPRAERFANKLSEVTGDTFALHSSELSGVGIRSNQPEYHVALVRHPIVVEHVLTHHTYIDQKENTLNLDHAPFTVFLRDSRAPCMACERFAVTSVHMPPRSRPRQTVVQGKGFLDSYMHQRGWPDRIRREYPFTFSGLDKHFATHIVGGDFNCKPSEDLDLAPSSWWTAFGKEVSTSSGNQAYDNFAVNAGAVRSAWMDASKDLGGFPLSRHGGSGLSDHDAVVLTMRAHLRHVILD